jgi:hypothetical protein
MQLAVEPADRRRHLCNEPARGSAQRSLIDEPNVAWPEIELSRLLLRQVLVRQFGYRIGRNALPNLCKHVTKRNRRHPALSPPDARKRNHNDRSAAGCRFSHHISMA